MSLVSECLVRVFVQLKEQTILWPVNLNVTEKT